jgi:hypothetical protein
LRTMAPPWNLELWGHRWRGWEFDIPVTRTFFFFFFHWKSVSSQSSESFNVTLRPESWLTRITRSGRSRSYRPIGRLKIFLWRSLWRTWNVVKSQPGLGSPPDSSSREIRWLIQDPFGSLRQDYWTKGVPS